MTARGSGPLALLAGVFVAFLGLPVLTLIGRERIAMGLADDALLIEAESLAAEAMRLD